MSNGVRWSRSGSSNGSKLSRKASIANSAVSKQEYAVASCSEYFSNISASGCPFDKENDDNINCNDAGDAFDCRHSSFLGRSKNKHKLAIYMDAIIRFMFNQWIRFLSALYIWIVASFAEFISNVLSQPKLQDLLCEIIVRAMNAFMDQEDIGDKMDDTARRVIYDREKAREASHAIGKEVVPMFTGFVGGVASSLTPSVVKRSMKKNRRRYKNEREGSQNRTNTVSELSLSDHEEIAEKSSEEEQQGDYVSAYSKKWK